MCGLAASSTAAKHVPYLEYDDASHVYFVDGEEVPSDTNPESMPGDGLGASTMMVMGRPK